MDLISYDVTNGQGFQASAERIATTLYRQHAQNQLLYLCMHPSSSLVSNQSWMHSIPFDETPVQNGATLGLSFAFGFHSDRLSAFGSLW